MRDWLEPPVRDELQADADLHVQRFEFVFLGLQLMGLGAVHIGKTSGRPLPQRKAGMIAAALPLECILMSLLASDSW